VSSSRKRPPNAQASGSARSLYENCLKLEKQSNRRSLDQLKETLVRDLTFRGSIFDAFTKRSSDPLVAELEGAVKYDYLLEIFRKTKNPDERLHILAQWLWAELDQLPEDSLGKETVARLSSADRERLRRLPLNDFYYTQLIQTWLPYAERLFQDAKGPGSTSRRLRQDLLSLGYEKNAVETYLSMSWKSSIEFTCQWLATRGGIKMLKPRKDPDMARTLRNAYSRILGQGAPADLRCNFCEKSAVADFYAEDIGSVSNCAAHSAEHLPTSSSEAWIDLVGRRWWRAGKSIRCEPPPIDTSK
jgi:hypothetical protein